MEILLLNGPNLNLLGTREPDVYGKETFDDCLKQLQTIYPEVTFHYFQSNIEGELINKLHEVGFTFDGVVLNAGGYTHTSVALRDAIAAITTPVVEVHISNTAKREEFRHHSYLTAVCKGVIMGFGLQSYELAVKALIG
ncbi:MAG: type II 3-dehydroquinate dehydratase [Marinifilaceae bacterium]